MKTLLLALFFLLLSTAATAQQPILLTEDAGTLGANRLETGTGVEYFEKHKVPAVGLPTSEIRLLGANTHIGVSDNVDFNLDWRGRLIARTDSRSTESDWGDLTISSKINVMGERQFPFSAAILTRVKLPNTTYLPFKLGSDQTDFYFHLLFSKHLSAVETRLNIGLGIVGDPVTPGDQDDIYIFSGAAIVPVWEDTRVFGEAYGFSGHLGYDDKLVLRFGVMKDMGGIELSAYSSIRAEGNNVDYGTAFESSENWSIGIHLSRTFGL